MQTLQQLCSVYPKAGVATENLRFNKKLRRMTIEAIVKLEGSTSPRDLANKIVQEFSSDVNLKFLFSDEVLQSKDKVTLVYEKLEQAITLSINAYTGTISKSMFEAEMMWANVNKNRKLKSKIKQASSSPDVHLTGADDQYRVYVTNPNILVAIVKGAQPFTYLTEDVKDRQRMVTPRDITIIQLDGIKALMLFNSPTDGIQRRFEVPMDRLEGIQFKSLSDGFIQDGLSIVERDLSGHEFDTNQFGELVGEKRTGIIQSVWCFDQTNRGRRGDQGEKGIRGQTGGDPNKFGVRTSQLAIDLAKEGKRLVTTEADYERAIVEREGWVLPMKKSLLDLWKTK
jgi:hypothetical protein